MKKLIVLFVMVIGVSMMAMAQKDDLQGKFKFSAGGELGYITGSNKNHASFGIGGNAQAEYFFTNKISGSVIGGFNFYPGKKKDDGSTSNYGNITIIPIKVGARYYLIDNLYGGLQIGVAFMSGGVGGTAFAYSPLIGYVINLKNDKAIDITLKYDGYAFGEKSYTNNQGNTDHYGGSLGALGVRLAYVF